MGNVLIVLAVLTPMSVFMDLPVLRQDATWRDRILYSVLLVIGLAVLMVSQINQSAFSPLTSITQALKGVSEWILQWHAQL